MKYPKGVCLPGEDVELQGLLPSSSRPLPLQVEASSAFRGVGLVKLMGRSSGFIAMQASMASGKVLDILARTDCRARTRQGMRTQTKPLLLSSPGWCLYTDAALSQTTTISSIILPEVASLCERISRESSMIVISSG